MRKTSAIKIRKRTATKPGKDQFPDFSTAEEFEALSAADKERVSKYYTEGHHLAEMRPLSAAERAELKRDRAKDRSKGRRPMLGKAGVKVIALSVERDLLKRAD